MNKTIKTLLLLPILLITVACVGGTGAANNPTPVLEFIGISAPQHKYMGGESVQFTATGYYEDNTQQDITKSMTDWHSSESNVIYIDASGHGVANAPGVARITAKYESMSANSENISVWDGAHQ